jgi:preprotein translocase subunit SecY
MLATEEIRKRILFTLLMLLIFRLLAAIPLPGINGEAFSTYFGDNPFSNIFTLVTGGRLDNPSIIAIGLGSYINASVVLQLLTSVIPRLEELSKEGERGRQVINQYTRYLTVPLSVLQGLVIYTILKRTPSLAPIIGEPSILEISTMIITLTGGTILLMWISELITEQGVGNGSSFIIFAGILSSLPGLIRKDLDVIAYDTALIISVVIGILIMIAGIIWVTESTRKIPIQYARRVRGRVMYGGQSSFLPLKINQAGVMPVIFAASFLTFPQIITQFFITSTDSSSFLYKASDWIGQLYTNENLWLYNLLYFIFILLFTFFYTFVVLNPDEQAENLKKAGGFIAGIRPGKSTAKHLTKIMVRLTTVGAIFLATVALIPTLARRGTELAFLSGIGGTSILIVVGVVLDMIRKLKSMIVARSYDSYK